MARRNRDTHAGVFHIVTHSIRDEDLFRREIDRVHFLRELGRAVARAEWRCVSFCLMRTHYHLILDVPEMTLPPGMHSLNFRYASWFNSEYGYRGHVMAARYWSRRIEGAADLLGTYKYVARNPVKARLCGRPELWPWSSHAATLGFRPVDFVDATDVLACFDGAPELRRAELREYVDRP
jgi:putative transposase